MDMPLTQHDVAVAEQYLAAGDVMAARPLLEQLVSEIEAYAAEELHTTDNLQYFSFESPFERVAYRRVEHDPRELVNIDVPFDRVYADYAFILIGAGEYEAASRALTQAVRWNPQKASYRLDLAELYRLDGNTQEWLALSNSVIERADDARMLARAYANFGFWFLDEGETVPAMACGRLAEKLSPRDARVQTLVGKVAEAVEKAGAEVADLSDEQAFAALEAEGVSAGANAEVAVCLLMCATDAAREGDVSEATQLTVRARDLVGEDACRALIALIRESDAELAAQGGAAGKAEAAEAPADRGGAGAGESGFSEPEQHEGGAGYGA